MFKKSGKKVLAVSHGRYRGIDVLELENGLLAICLGVEIYFSRFLTELTALIDHYHDLKKN